MKEEIINELNNAIEKLGKVSNFICIIIEDKEVGTWFISQKYSVPERFKGEYWVGRLDWWDVVVSTNDYKLPELIQLKKDYLKWLIDQVENDKIEI